MDTNEVCFWCEDNAYSRGHSIELCEYQSYVHSVLCELAEMDALELDLDECEFVE